MSSLQILNSDQATNLGYDDNSKTYAIGFLLNDKLNNAAQPGPFKVAKSALLKIAKTAKNKPWIPGTKGENDMHISKDGVADQTQVLDFHRKYAGGTIVDYYINESTGNVSVIVEIFPEFVQMIKNGEISNYLSPMIGNLKIDDVTGEIIDGEIVHLHSVDIPGYSKSIAKFTGTCDGPIGTCMKELQAVAAAGKIVQYRNSSIECPVNFLKGTQTISSSSMDPTATPPVTPTATTPPTTPAPDKINDDLVSAMGEVKDAVAAMGDEMKKVVQVEDGNAEVLREVATANGIDGNRVLTVASMGEQHTPEPVAANQPVPPQTMSSAGNTLADQKIAKLEGELKKIREDQTNKDQKALEVKRLQQATIIAKGEVYLREGGMSKKDLANRVKYYNELKDGETPVDLTLTASKYQKIIDGMVENSTTQPTEEPLVVSAAGLLDDGYPVVEEPTPDYDRLEGSI